MSAGRVVFAGSSLSDGSADRVDKLRRQPKPGLLKLCHQRHHLRNESCPFRLHQNPERSSETQAVCCRHLACKTIVQEDQIGGIRQRKRQRFCFAGTQVTDQLQDGRNGNGLNRYPGVAGAVWYGIALLSTDRQFADDGLGDDDTIIELFEEMELPDAIELEQRGGVRDDTHG
jgi:hypothetical protein